MVEKGKIRMSACTTRQRNLGPDPRLKASLSKATFFHSLIELKSDSRHGC